MELLTHTLETANRPPLKSQLTSSGVISLHRIILKMLFLILASAVVVSVGPVALRTAASASLVLIQILLELGQLCLAVFHIFGT